MPNQTIKNATGKKSAFVLLDIIQMSNLHTMNWKSYEYFENLDSWLPTRKIFSIRYYDYDFQKTIQMYVDVCIEIYIFQENYKILNTDRWMGFEFEHKK